MPDIEDLDVEDEDSPCSWDCDGNYDMLDLGESGEDYSAEIEP